MLKKYLQFLIDSFENISTLVGTNSQWSKNFVNFGNEI